MAHKIFISYKICISFCSILGDSYGSKIFISHKICISFCSILGGSYRPEDIQILQDMHIFLLHSRTRRGLRVLGGACEYSGGRANTRRGLRVLGGACEHSFRIRE